MKTSIATTVSIAAVLVAGGAAFAVNTQALNGGSPSSESVPEVQVLSLSANPAASNASATTTVPGTPTTISTPGADTQNEYELAGVGVVSLKLSSTTLAVAKVQPVVGFTYSTWQIATDQIRVEFLSATSDIEFRARLIDGRVVTDVQSSNIAQKSKVRSDDDDKGEHEGNKKHEDRDNHEQNEGHDDDD
ncbi:MAG: hypothetical protein EB142_04990 [Actinobacteria bacterium]|nr:hypothetical protein [Actinomycetota bacterium]